MTLAADIANVYQYIDGIETVTHTVYPAGTATATVKGQRGELSFREVASNGPAGIESTDMVWELWATTLASGAVPRQGDTITDSAGTVWQVLAVGAGSKDRIGTTVIRYRCVCRQQV